MELLSAALKVGNSVVLLAIGSHLLSLGVLAEERRHAIDEPGFVSKGAAAVRTPSAVSS